MTRKRQLFVYLWLTLLAAAPALAKEPLSFELTFSQKLRDEAFTGRVIIFLSDKPHVAQPRLEQSWGSRQPIFSKDVKNWAPGEVLRFTDPMGWPYSLEELPAGEYAVQAVMHTNPDEPHSGRAVGNLYSKTIRQEIDPKEGGIVKLQIKRRVKNRIDDLGIPRGKLVELRSNLLSQFHERDIFMRALVVLPQEYEQSADRRFPALYIIPGFGGDHYQAAMYSVMLGVGKAPMVRVGLDATCPLGHHVFADSENNGPWGLALVEELVPYLEKTYRLIPEPGARLLTGHSSGGWSSLWLQVTHPDYFGGVWSTSPDPVDFHDFCGLNLYDRKTNFFRNEDGERRPIMRTYNRVEMWFDDFAHMEETIGPGGQMQSFEAVFSPRGPDGNPMPVFNRKTGKIDPDVVKHWRKYDIADKLQREWTTLGPKLSGKITVIMGGKDTFYLEGAALRLKNTLEELGSDARVTIVPGKDHGTIMFTKPFRAMVGEMTSRFAASQPATAPIDMHE